MNQCKICGKNIAPEDTHFSLTFNKEATENGGKKILQSEEGAVICEECGQEGLPSVLHHLKIIHDADTELNKKMESIAKSMDIMKLMKEYGISGEKIGTDNEYLAKCPFHNQEASFLIDADKKEYFCFCEGLRGDAFSFVINYDRDVNHKHTTLKQAVDFLMEKFQVQVD
ncbi:MAG: CHC2 zinc finger domain-containing protein [Candidatus Aminicenantes bacterium]